MPVFNIYIDWFNMYLIWSWYNLFNTFYNIFNLYCSIGMNFNPTDHWSNFNRLKAFQIIFLNVTKIGPNWNSIKLLKKYSNSTKNGPNHWAHKKLSNKGIIGSKLNWTQVQTNPSLVGLDWIGLGWISTVNELVSVWIIGKPNTLGWVWVGLKINPTQPTLSPN